MEEIYYGDVYKRQGQAVILLKIEKQIFHIRIRQGAGVPAPAQVPHNVHPVSQEVQPDGVPQQRVMARCV